jgi:hypothetical protein
VGSFVRARVTAGERALDGHWYHSPDVFARERERILTNRQDWRINELTQAGVGSRAYIPGPYANGEGLLAAFDRHYLRTMGA